MDQISNDPGLKHKSDFMIEEYKRLTKEISDRDKEIGDLERYSVIGVTAYYAWVATHVGDASVLPTKMVWSLPIVLALFVAFRTLIYAHRIDAIISPRLVTIEKYFCIETGYEEKMQTKQTGWLWKQSTRLGGSTFLVWAALFAGTIFVAFSHKQLFGR